MKHYDDDGNKLTHAQQQESRSPLEVLEANRVVQSATRHFSESIRALADIAMIGSVAERHLLTHSEQLEQLADSLYHDNRVDAEDLGVADDPRYQ